MRRMSFRLRRKVHRRDMLGIFQLRGQRGQAILTGETAQVGQHV